LTQAYRISPGIKKLRTEIKMYTTMETKISSAEEVWRRGEKEFVEK
jgi:hypothetical protein